MFLAASVMYEQSLRLAHYTTLNALEKQVKCLLAAKNALSLVIPEWRWVVKPSTGEQVTLKIIQPIDAENQVRAWFMFVFCLFILTVIF